MSFKKSRNRILLFDGTRAFHLCTVRGTTDGSVLVTPSRNNGLVKKLVIEMRGEKPVVTSIEVMKNSNKPFHATYHQKSGYKHIRENRNADALGEILVIFNTEADPTFSKVDFFEPLLKIFPTRPDTYPFVEATRPTDILVELAMFNNNPISFFFAVTNAKDEAIQIRAPEGTLAFPVRLDGKTVLVTTTLLRKEDGLVETWPKRTMWATPY